MSAQFPNVEAMGVPVYTNARWEGGDGKGWCASVVRAADLEAALAPLLEIAKCVEAERSKKSAFPNPYPGHGHSRPGIWDDDNGALAGKKCAACSAFEFFDRFVVRDTAEGLLRELVENAPDYICDDPQIIGVIKRASKLLGKGA